jgi:hypothetical protein
MVGIDGVLLASDTKCTRPGGVRGAFRSSSNQPKIRVEENENAAYCWSGDDLCEDAARIFCVQPGDLLSDSQIHNRLVESAQKAIADEGIAKRSPALQGGAVLFAFRLLRGSSQLWYLNLDLSAGGRSPKAQPVFTYLTTGDFHNAAGFFLERYFPKRRKVPIQDLVPLAAHTVLQAGELNNAGVGGLEIVRCTSAGFEKVSEDEISVLTDRSEKLDAEISVSLKLSGKRSVAAWRRWLWR